MDYGETAMWGTIGGAVVGGVGGYVSYKEQNPKITHSWSTERKDYWKGQANNPNSAYYGNTRAAKGLAPIGSDGHSMVLHHPYGQSGAGLYTYYPMTRTDHMAFHGQYGYKGFHGGYPYSNFWEMLMRSFGG
jgi:hypothetical protein